MHFILENAIFTQHFVVSVTSSKAFALEWWKSDWRWNVFTWMMKEWVRVKCCTWMMKEWLKVKGFYLNDERVTEGEMFSPEWWKSGWEWNVCTWMTKERVRMSVQQMCLGIKVYMRMKREALFDICSIVTLFSMPLHVALCDVLRDSNCRFCK